MESGFPRYVHGHAQDSWQFLTCVGQTCSLRRAFTTCETERTQNYLVVRGPYQFTRNPMYLSGMVIWLGWIIFYGSVAVLGGAVVFWGSVALLVVPWEEHKLEARFGEAYLRYKNSVPRWVGKKSRWRP